MAQVIHNLTEIDQNIRNRYRDRLGPRSQKIKRLLSERRWSELRLELNQLKITSKDHGFKEVFEMSERAEKKIPTALKSRSVRPKGVYEATTHLLNTIDTILGRNSWVH